MTYKRGMTTSTRNMGFDSLRIMLNFYLNIFTIDLPGVRLMVHSLVSSFLPRSKSFQKKIYPSRKISTNVGWMYLEN